MTHRDIIKLNLGCGPSGIEGWLNYDWGLLPVLSKLPLIRKILISLKLLSNNYDVQWSNIKLVNITNKFPLNDNSVSYIYCSHVLEHFEKYETEKILFECFRVLKVGGVMRIVLPDLKKMVNDYSDADVFNRMFFGYDKDIKSFTNLFIRGHQWMYDDKSIILLLNIIFKTVKLKKCGLGDVPDLNQLDLESHKDHSLYVEVLK